MAKSLSDSYDDLERRRLALLARVEGWDNDRLNAQPQPGKWSIVQILCHLTLAEGLSLASIRKQLSDPSGLPKSGVASAVKTWALKMFLRSRLKFKAPARSTDLPDQQSFEVTKSEWDNVRRGVKEVIDSFPTELEDSLIFKHPVMGPMNISQTLSFFSEHFDHHARQVNALLAGGR
jgi:uncharacterized damage-inducible protein DinB